MKKLKFVVERHPDGYVVYPLGLKGAVVGQGNSYESALADAKSAAAFHIESFGKEAFDENAAWDRQIDADFAEDGRLRPVLDEVRENIRTGRLQELP